jgi:hypothetical protein
MRRSGMAGAVLTVGTLLGVLTPAAGCTAAGADGPQHVKSTLTSEETIPVGELCDFDYHNVTTGSETRSSSRTRRSITS